MHAEQEEVPEIRAQFERAEADLQFVLQKLENEFAAKFDPASPQLNPLNLLHRLKRIEEALPAVERDAARIVELQQELQRSARQVRQCRDLLQQMDTQDPPGAMAVAVTATDETCAGESVAPSSEPELKENSKPVGIRRSGQFVPITEEEFASVAGLTRGRAQLEHVNELYQQLIGYFASSEGAAAAGRGQWLSREQMAALGAKVRGNTGESKLAILHALRLFRVSRHGVLPR